jgi:pyridoxamine 5'-phosphate oxidase
MTQTAWRDTLRALPVFSGELPTFDTDAAPATPVELLEQWLGYAINAGVSQPHAMTISTVGEKLAPSARTLLLKDVTDDGLWFATLSSSPKGLELEQNPNAALALYWREQGRQVRVTGTVEKGPRAVSEQDFLARSPGARAAAIAGPESGVLASKEKFAERVEEAKAIIDFKPDFVPDDWVAYVLRPTAVEFWQASRERDQVRLKYTAESSGWRRELLWP